MSTFKSNADAVIHKANQAVYEVLGEFADDAVSKAKSNAPVGKTGKKKQKDSIGCRFATGTAYVGTNWYIGRLVETGFTHRSGKHVNARPFIKPAVLSAYSKVKANLKSKLENA